MRALKNLAGQTIVYGFGTMVPRLLNYIILTPYFTRLYNTVESQVEYGKVTELYAYVVFLMIILTYGMETAYFRYSNNEKDRKIVFSTIFTSILVTSTIFIFLIFCFPDFISNRLKYGGETYFIKYLASIVTIESISAIPFAKLRIENKVKRFAILRIIQVLLNITFILGFYNVVPFLVHSNSFLLNSSGIISAKFIFLSNLLSSGIVLLLLIPDFLDYKLKYFDVSLYFSIIVYGLPLMLSGLAGVINETLDRSIFKHVYIGDSPLRELGIYGANYKLASIVMIAVQMFRYAAEPFFFNYEKADNAKQTYAQIMHFTVGFLVLIVIILLLFIDIFKIFIDKQYHEGLIVVPIIAFAYILYGILFNLSIWFKLSNKTYFAILITLIGAIITIWINLLYVPKYSYLASAVAHILSYSAMILLSFFLGRIYYRVPYNLFRILLYILLGFIVYFIDYFIDIDNALLSFCFKVVLVFIFGIFIIWKENIIRFIKITKDEN